jgi:serine/threonine protein kinase
MNARTIGNYELEGLLGEGGIGQVYAAQDKTLGRPVAIKMLRPELSRDKNFVDRFHVEAKSLGNLNHSNITTLYALHAEGEEAFMVMELVHGYTLEALLARVQRLTLRDSLAILAQVVAGMRYAHRRGVIHRDLKPANLMVTDDGVVKIMDFGIARVRGSEHLTRVGEFCGTFVYASPEQIRGEEVDERSDLYSLAIVFYRMLAGTAPFASDNEYALMTAQLQTPPPPLSGRVPDLDAGTEQALMRALAKRPEDRFDSVEAFGRAVGAMALRGESVDILQQLYARVFESDDVEATRIVTLRRPAAVDQTMPSNRPDWRPADSELRQSLPRSAPAYPEPQSNRADWQLAGTQVLPNLGGSGPANPEPWSSRGDRQAAAAEPPASARLATLPANRRAGLLPWLIVAGGLALPLALGGGYYAFIANGPTQLAASSVPSQPLAAEPPPLSPLPPSIAPVRTEAPPPPAPPVALVEAAKPEPQLPPAPAPAPVEAAKAEPQLPPAPAPAPVEAGKPEPQLPPAPAPAPVEVAKAEPQLPLAPAPPVALGEALKAEPQLSTQQVPEDPAKTEPRPATDRPASGIQVATTQPQTPPEPAPSLGPEPPASAPKPEGEPDLQGRVTGAKRLDEFEVAGQWIKLYGIVDRARGPQEAQRVQALLRYLKPSHNVVVCYRKAADTYRCYADGQDIARLALQDGMAQLAPNAPSEYRSLLAQRR